MTGIARVARWAGTALAGLSARDLAGALIVAAFLVAASALAAVVLYRYVDVGAIGPFPNLYEPTWQVPGKLTSAYAEGIAVLLSAVGVGLTRSRRHRI